MLSVIVKGTNGCNLACSYCSLGRKTNVEKLSASKLYGIMKYSSELCIQNNENALNFILHGGEPTLIAPSIYEEAIIKIKKEYPDLKIHILMQTNGYHISDEWVKFFKQYDVSVGISMDGSAEIHDKERRTPNHGKTFEKIKKNIFKLQENHINVSCLMVLTSYALDKGFEFLEYFEQEQIHLKINPLLDYGEVYEHPELSLQVGQYSDYIIKLYEYILTSGIDVSVSPIDNFLIGIIHRGMNINECSFKKVCNKSFLCIDYKGNMYPCGKYADMEKYCLGNIEDNNYDIFSSEIICKLLKRRNEALPVKCKNCKYVQLCNAGCNAEADIANNISSVPAMCEDYYKLFEYFTGKGLELLKQELIKKKIQLKGTDL